MPELPDELGRARRVPKLDDDDRLDEGRLDDDRLDDELERRNPPPKLPPDRASALSTQSSIANRATSVTKWRRRQARWVGFECADVGIGSPGSGQVASIAQGDGRAKPWPTPPLHRSWRNSSLLRRFAPCGVPEYASVAHILTP